MGNESASIKFALIGHGESWENIMQYIQTMRLPGNSYDLTLEKVKDIFSYIPPRKIFDIEVSSAIHGKMRGVYIETFIAPNELDISHLRKNMNKVKQACALCAKLKIPIVSLGGFSSIVLEAGNESFTKIEDTFFTTGNSLTAAFITKGVEKASAYWQQPLSASKLLIIGSTGDIGSACTLYFSGKVRKLLLCARQAVALQKQSNTLTANGVVNSCSIHLKELVAEADIIICVASTIINENDFENMNDKVIVCDAGYPKNLQTTHIKNHERLFYGGMGNVTGGYSFENNLETVFYKFPLQTIGHGCLLEAVVLAMDNKFCSFSNGKGNITLKAIKDILEIANKHGVQLAPLFNKNLIDERTTSHI